MLGIKVIAHKVVTQRKDTSDKNLKKTVLDNRQFVGLLLLACSIASFVIVMVVTAHPPDDSLESMTAHLQAEEKTVETFGFLLPPLQSFIAPLLAVTTLLAIAYLWLSARKGSTV